jgi:hypothetical protein
MPKRKRVLSQALENLNSRLIPSLSPHRSYAHLIHCPSGHLAGLDVSHTWKQLAVLLSAKGKVLERVGRHGGHEDRLVKSLLCLLG